MGHRAAIGIGGGTIGLALLAWPVTVSQLGTSVECGPAFVAVLQRLDSVNEPDPNGLKQSCGQRGYAMVLSGGIVVAGSCAVAGVREPRRRD
jgi:hypothetical protein